MPLRRWPLIAALLAASHSAHSEEDKAEPRKQGFPRERLIDGLLGRVKTPRAVVVGFTRWFDGVPALILGQERSLRPVGKDFKARASVPLAWRPEWARLLPASVKPRSMVLVATDLKTDREAVVAINAKGKRLWSYFPTRSITQTVLLYDAKGPYGVGLGTLNYGLVGVDLTGQKIWELKGRLGYDLRTHPRLPNQLLVADGTDVALFAHDRSEIAANPRHSWTPRQSGILASHCLLFPGPKGEPAMLLGGEGDRVRKPVIARVDVGGRRLWQAFLPHHLEGLGMLEPAGRKRVFVAVTWGFDLFLFDDEGTLLWRRKLHHGKEDPGALLSSIETGPLDVDTWGIALVRLGRRPWIYMVDVSRLPKVEQAKKK